MRTSVVVWVIWLLVWHGSGSHAQEQQVQVTVTGPITIKATAQAASLSSGSTCQGGSGCSGAQDIQVPQTTTTIITAAGATIRAGETQGPSLHEYVYRNDFAGLRDKLKALDKKENHPALIGSLQSTDDKGLTIAHLLACVGRPEELSLVTQAVHSILSGLVPLGQQVFKRASLESLSFNASCTSCRSDRSQNEVIPHLRLELTNPRQTTFLYGNVTPLECAAAHGHTEAMKLLMLQGVHPGRVLLVAQHFGLENNLFEAVRQAKADGGLGVLLHPDMPDKLEAPMRKPRQRRTELKTKTKAKSGSSAKQKQAAAAAAGTTAPAAATCASCSANQQQQGQGSCGAQPPPLTMTPQPGLQRPGGAPNVIGTVATSILGAAKGKDPHQDPSKPAGTPSHLSEVMDVTALWLLSIMLLFPAWSTLCLLWRKLLKRRAALHDCLARTRRAVVAVARPSKPSGATAAAPAAAPGGSGTSRAAAAEQAEAKASSSKPGGATPRQQRKPGPSIALPASSGTDPGATANSNKTCVPSAGLFRAISAPEGSLRAHAGASSSSSGGSQAASAAGQVAGVRRQGSSAAMVASAAGAAPAGPELVPPPRQGSSPNLASAATPAASSALKAPSAGAAAGKQKRSKLGVGASVTFASAPTGSKDKEQEASKGSKQAPAAANNKAGSSSGSAGGSTSSAAKVTRTGSGASDSSTASSPAPPAVKGAKGPQVLHRASKAGGSSSASPKAAAAASAGVYKTRSEASGLLAAANSKSAAKAAVEAAAASVAAASQAACSSSSSPRTKPTSALSAALKPAAGPASSAGPPAADPAAAGSSSSSSGRTGAPRKGGATGTTSRGSGAQTPSPQPVALSPTAAAPGGSSSSSSRFTGSAAASAAAAASLRRTASGGVVLSPRSPLKDLNDVLNRTRDQDRPHSTTGAAAAAAAAAASSRHVAASAPSSNAWTPAAAAARAARAAGSSSAKPHQADEPEGQEDTADEEGSSAQRVAAAAAEAAASSAGASADESQARLESSNSSSTAAAGAASTAEAGSGPPVIYVDSFTAAAVAAGILPSPTAATPAVEQRAGPAAAPKQGLLNAHDSSFDAAEAAAATAYAAAVAALPSDADGEMAALSAADADALHAPELDPPVSLLPAGLLSRLDAAPGRPSSSGSSGNGALLRSVSALEPKVVQDLADMVAAAIAQEVAHGTLPAGAAGGPSQQAEDAGAGRVSDSGARVSEGGSGAGSSSNGGGAQLTGSQLVQLSLQEALTALTASKQPAEVSGAAVLPAVAEHSALTAGGAADPFNISSADLFADLAQKLKLPTHNSPQKPQQQQQQQQGAEQQQQGWFGPAAVSAADVGAGVASNPMQVAAGGPVLVDPAGLMCNPPRLMGLQGGISMPVSTTALQAPPGLQMPPASGVSAMSIPAGPAGAALLTAQQLVMQQQVTMHQHPQLVAAQPMHQQQVLHPQQQQQQQQIMVQQGQQMVAVGPGGAQQVQLVQMQPVRAAAGQQGPLIRLANGQIVQGQVISVPGQVGGMALVAAGPSGAPVIMAPGGVVMQQQVQVQHMAPQQQPVSAQRVFFPHTLVQGQQQPQGVYAAQQGQQMVQGQLQGGVRAIAPAAASPALPARQAMRSQLHPGQMAHHAAGPSNLSSSPAQHVTLLQRPAGGPVVGSPAGGGGVRAQQQKLAAQQASSSVSSSPKVTVLEAPAGPGSVPGPQASGSPMHKILASGRQRHSDTGPRPQKGQAGSVQSGSTGAAEPGSPAVAEAQSDLHPTESAQMAADLDELLQQANEELGFSCLPAAARSPASPAAAGVAASPSSTAALECLQLPEGFTTQ